MQWRGEGAKGVRPESPLPALEERLRALHYDALGNLTGETLSEKAGWR